MIILSSYALKLERLAHRPIGEKISYYLLPTMPLISGMVGVLLGYKRKKSVLQRLMLSFVSAFAVLVIGGLFGIQLPFHRTDYAGWEGWTFWGITPSQETCLRMMVVLVLSSILLFTGYYIGKIIKSAVDFVKVQWSQKMDHPE